MNQQHLLLSSRFFHTALQKTSICEISEECFKSLSTVHTFSQKELLKMLYSAFPKHNQQELESLIRSYCDALCIDSDTRRDSVDFFEAVKHFAFSMIHREDNRLCFRYENSEIWRTLTRNISEEVFVIAAVVQNDFLRQYRNRVVFDWPTCIEHDSFELKKVLRHGMGVSENHFHMRGSSPYFDLSWTLLMNQVDNKQFEREVEKLQKNRLSLEGAEPLDDSLKLIWRKAAAIRLYLFQYVTGKFVEHSEQKLAFEDVLRMVLTYTDKPVCSLPVDKLQERIGYLNTYGDLDYAQSEQQTKLRYGNLFGERFILYRTLRKIYYEADAEETEFLKAMLFLYLAIKNRFFREIVQCNHRVGFYNFDLYQQRKDSFLKWNMESVVATETITGMIDGIKPCKMELRISPGKDWKDIAEAIDIYDRAIRKAAELEGISPDDLLKHFYYVTHFVKFPEAKYPIDGHCRHYEFRQELKQRQNAILDLRDHKPELANRIYGIDACGAEIDCRPEVFGPCYRYLQDYARHAVCDSYNNDFNQLRATYHVGEDNYDIVDGLRAIDEAITFLDLHSGSRLGHATLLGIDCKHFCTLEKNPVNIKKQIFLDNLVWMYYFIQRNNFSFENLPNLKRYIEDKFSQYFKEIFLRNIDFEMVKKQLKGAVIDHKKYDIIDDEVLLQFEHLFFNCSINNYYLSYLLRGDDPELYQSGRLNSNYSFWEVCHSDSKMDEARRSVRAVYLNYLYAYNQNVKKTGNEVVSEILPDYFMEAVALVQKHLQKKISERGIGIETNPSSNLFISVLDSYAEHPIVDFYSEGLNPNRDGVQLNVSINTDDKSVFSTTLSNEYAFLMYDLEHRKRYHRIDVLRWLDNIRQMGNEQSFAPDKIRW